MSKHISSEFDPFRVVTSFASEANIADLFIDTFIGAGLAFDVSLDGNDNYSHANRIRALRPRLLAAYDGLSPEAKLAAANASTGRFISRVQRLQHLSDLHGFSERMLGALQKIGWGFQEDRLVALDPEIREMFFPKNSQWDAFVAIRKVIANAKSQLMIVDPYCDHAFFALLESSGARAMAVRLLCRNNPGSLKAEAKAFSDQHHQVSIELRTSADFHDRFLVVDQAECVHLGASINHAGSRAFMISAVEDSRNRDALIKAVNQAWSNGIPV